jgi:FtsH-binding integral membrane protein
VVEGSQPGLRQVIAVAAVAVAAVLGAAVLTSLLPVGIQQLVFHQPLAIAVLVAGTALVLWRVATRRPPAE